MTNDYRGVPVIAAYRWLADLRACLVVKIDQAEAFEPTRTFGATLLAVGALALLAGSGLAYGLARTITRPVREMQAVATRFGQGDLAARLPEIWGGELGLLAREFNTMAAALTERDADLRRHAAELESANKELDAFSYSISHDLRAPLRAVDGFARILLEDHAPEVSPEARRYLSLVRDNAWQIGRLVEDLLALSRLGRQPLKKETVAPLTLVSRALENLHAEQAGRAVEFSVGDLPPCQADPGLLTQVFVNLLSNALKFTRKREEARIEIGSTTISDCKLQIQNS